jgi:hypothetical protein
MGYYDRRDGSSHGKPSRASKAKRPAYYEAYDLPPRTIPEGATVVINRDPLGGSDYSKTNDGNPLLGLDAKEWAAMRDDPEVTKDWFRPRDDKGDIGGPMPPDHLNPKIKWASGPKDPNYYNLSYWARPREGQNVLQARAEQCDAIDKAATSAKAAA